MISAYFLATDHVSSGSGIFVCPVGTLAIGTHFLPCLVAGLVCVRAQQVKAEWVRGPAAPQSSLLRPVGGLNQH